MPPSCGFPPKSSPLKGNPPFWGKPDAIDALRSNRYTFGAARRDWRGAQQSLDFRFGHEGVRGRRLHGAAMLCRLQCARFAIRWHIADALPSSPRHSHGRRRLSKGGKPPVKVWLGGSTPNKITSCLRTSRSEFLLIHFCSRHGNEQLDGASLNTPFLFRRRDYAPLSQAFTGGATAS